MTCTAVVIGVLGAAAPSASATGIEPQGDNLSADAGTFSLTTSGGYTATCTSANITGTAPTTTSGVDGGPINVPLTSETFSGCSAIGVSAPVTTSGIWTADVDYNGGSPQASINIPAGGATVDIGPGLCRITASPASVVGPGAWTDGTDPDIDLSRLDLSAAGVVNISATGLFCPSGIGNTGTLTASFRVRDTDTPGSLITVQNE